MKKIFLSVVIIAKNEEERIKKCLDSIMKLKQKYNTQIIFVDSASTDNTIMIADRYPIEIYQLNKSKYLNPSAGRYIGTSKAKGEYILFIDGDSILIEEFVDKALQILKDPKIAVVGGKRLFRKKGESLKIIEKSTGKIKEYKTIGGTGLYKKTIIEKSGTFNPYMCGQEERELCFRIRNLGYKIVKIEIPMEVHINKEMSIEEASEKAGYFIGVGQIIRHYGFKSITRELIKAQHKALIETMIVLSSIIWIILTVFFHSIIFIIGSAAIVLAILALAIYKGPSKVGIQLLARIKLFSSIIKGFIKDIDKAKSFDKKVKVKTIKK
jgi:glycosyltransferase involved in cell wall biosynthesis